ncbi:MAG TPA: hypothetical protein H9682_04420 [Firmicutes bacterium]|nr:hypothetical protein [Bacillota bacterium]
MNTVLSQAMAAVEQPRQSLAISLSRGLVVIVAFVLLFAQLWGVTGVWMAFPATEILTFVLALAIYFHFKRRRDALKQKQSAD